MNGQWKHHGRRENGGNTPTFALPRTRTPVLIKKKEKKKRRGGGPIVHTSSSC